MTSFLNQISPVLSLYWKVIGPQRRLVARLVVFSLISGLMEGTALLFLVPILNKGFSHTNPPPSFIELFGHAWSPSSAQNLLLWGLIGFFLLGMTATMSRYLFEIGLLRFRAFTELYFRERLYKALLGMSWSSFSGVRMGDISKAMSLEVNDFVYGAEQIIQCTGVLLTTGALFVLALGLSPKMTLITVGFGILIVLLHRQLKRLVFTKSENLSTSFSGIALLTDKFFSQLKFLRASGLTHFMAEQLQNAYRHFAEGSYRIYSYNPLSRLWLEIFGLLFVGMIIVTALWGTPYAFGRVVVFLAIFYRIAPRLISMQQSYAMAVSKQSWYSAWEERYENALAHQNQGPTIEHPLPHAFESIRVDAVNVNYGSKVVLENVSFSLPVGKSLAFVGESGGGKTTLLDVVTGLVKPVGGQCTINGIPLSDLPIDRWRSKIGLVMQNTPIFHGTVLDNIALVDPTPDRAKAQQCARLAEAWDFIDQWPSKLDTPLGEKGAKISQGQAQRLALARALYREPWMLILDEVTSALDAQSEAAIVATLKGLQGKTTLLMVTHRLNTVDFADEIMVLHQGQIREKGTYSELLNKPDGHFKRLAKLQGLIH